MINSKTENGESKNLSLIECQGDCSSCKFYSREEEGHGEPWLGVEIFVECRNESEEVSQWLSENEMGDIWYWLDDRCPGYE